MLPYDFREYKDMKLSELIVVALVIVGLAFVLHSTISPIREKIQAEAEAKAVEEKINSRFDIIGSQSIEYKTIHVLRDKETDQEYFMATYRESISFGPLVKKEER